MIDKVIIKRFIPSSGVPTFYVLVEGKDFTQSIYATSTFLHVARIKAKTICTMSGKLDGTPKAELELWEKLDAPNNDKVQGGMFEDKAKANG